MAREQREQKVTTAALAEVIERLREGSTIGAEAQRAGYSHEASLRNRLKRTMGSVAYANLIKQIGSHRKEAAARQAEGTSPATEATSGA